MVLIIILLFILVYIVWFLHFRSIFILIYMIIMLLIIAIYSWKHPIVLRMLYIMGNCGMTWCLLPIVIFIFWIHSLYLYFCTLNTNGWLILNNYHLILSFINWILNMTNRIIWMLLKFSNALVWISTTPLC